MRSDLTPVLVGIFIPLGGLRRRGGVLGVYEKEWTFFSRIKASEGGVR